MKKENTHGNRDHAEVGSSSAKGYLSCVGYKRETRPKPPHPTTLSGTRCHEALDTNDLTLLEDESEIPLVQFCAEYAASLGPYTEVLMEQRLYVLFDDWFGYYDRLCFKGPAVAHMFDWKFGYVPVDDAEVNPQGWFLAIGAFDKYPELMNLYVHFPQPRIGQISRHLFTRPAVEKLKLVFLAAKAERGQYEKLGRPVEMLNPSYENCKYCGNMSTCEAMINLVLEADRKRAAKKGTSLTVPDAIDAKEVNSPQTLKQLRDLADVTYDWADNTKWHVGQKRLQEGIEIPGYKLVSKKGTLSVTNPLTVYKLAAKYGLTAEDIASCSDFSVSKLKKIVGKKAARGQGRARIQSFEDDLIDQDAVEQGPDSSYLKREVTSEQV